MMKENMNLKPVIISVYVAAHKNSITTDEFHAFALIKLKIFRPHLPSDLFVGTPMNKTKMSTYALFKISIRCNTDLNPTRSYKLMLMHFT